MPKLYEKSQDRLLGTISAGELSFLMEQLEEESSTDRDYNLDADTIEMLVEAGAPANLVTLLESALGPAQDGEVRWEDD
ncbi:MAG TPA: galactosyldiacylglycerol synthase [Candidatus Saccharimonadia bacterium]|nr:galactosyldiacylglycerol synthase [Candidatus Saccharimonadia bacterium]